MTDSDKLILRVIADNPALLTALRSVLENAASALPSNASATAFSDERLGQIARSRIASLETIDLAFQELAKCKSHEPIQERVNRAR